MPKQISALQLYNLQHVISGDIPLTARRMSSMSDWTDHYRMMSMGTTSLDRMHAAEENDLYRKKRLVRETAFDSSAWGTQNSDILFSLPGDTSIKINREAMLTTMYFDALRENRLSDAQSLSALDVRLRKHWNSRVQDIQQTKVVRQMLGDKATPDVFMSNTERVAFYNNFINNKSLSKSEREYNNYLLYMYYYGCAIHAILNAMLHARGMSLTDAQYEEFLRALYERRDEVFTSDDFDKSYRLVKDTSGNVTSIDNKAKNIILKNNLKGANIIKEILQKNLNMDMSDIFVVDETTRKKEDNDVLIEGSYAVTAEGSGNTAHKFVQDTVTKTLFDSLKGRNTKYTDKQERLWIGTTTGISGSAY